MASQTAKITNIKTGETTVTQAEDFGVFNGETMVCVFCGKERKSNPEVSSDWRGMELDDFMVYACPKHFPPDGARAGKFAKAHMRMMLAGLVCKSANIKSLRHHEELKNATTEMLEQVLDTLPGVGWK